MEQINSGIKGITVQMNEQGKLSYTRTEGEETNEGADRLTQAIDDHSVDVSINTTNNSRNSLGGAAAKMSQESGVPSGPDRTPGRVYTEAHDAALKQPGGNGSVGLSYYDNKGNLLPANTPPSQVYPAYWKARNGKLIYGVIKP